MATSLDEVLDRAALRRVELPSPKRCKAIRTLAGVTQVDMAELLDVDRVSISRWEGGQRQPRGELRVRYLELLQQLRERAR